MVPDTGEQFESRRPCWWDVVVLAGRFQNG